MAKEWFLGTGLKFPLQVNKTTGRFVMSQGQDNVKESLYMILMTQQSERFTRPEFGSRMMSYTFMDTSETMLNVMARDIQNTILTQEPRIAKANVNISQKLEQGCLMVDIQYMLRETNTMDNMVFPFYLYAEKEPKI